MPKQVDFVDEVSGIDKRIYNGGSRSGAGRKKGVETKAIRVPVDLLPQIQALMNEDQFKIDFQDVYDYCLKTMLSQLDTVLPNAPSDRVSEAYKNQRQALINFDKFIKEEIKK